MLGVTASLAIENAIKDALDKNRYVLIVSATGKIKQHLERFKILEMISPHHLMLERKQALTLITPQTYRSEMLNSSQSNP